MLRRNICTDWDKVDLNVTESNETDSPRWTRSLSTQWSEVRGVSRRGKCELLTRIQKLNKQSNATQEPRSLTTELPDLTPSKRVHNKLIFLSKWH